MRRREVITLLSAAAICPFLVHAQQGMPTIGWLSSGSAAGFTNWLADFSQGLKEGGFTEGQNVVIEYRWAGDQDERLPQLAADLVGRQVAVIVTGSGTPAALAAKAATSTIPIVFSVTADPVRAGLVNSLNRPGGNVTGVAGFTDVLITKRLELMTELVPSAAAFGALLNRNNPNSQNRSRDLQIAAQQVSDSLRILSVGSHNELEKAIAAAAQERMGGLVIQNDQFFISNAGQLAALASRSQLPTIYESRQNIEAGGLISYGTSSRERFHLLGSYTGRILKGERPSDLPVQQPTKFALVINLKTAKALGITIPPALLARADEVIQ